MKSNDVSDFSGFLDGYKAYNLELVGSSIKFYLEEILDSIKYLETNIVDKNLQDLLSKAKAVINPGNTDLIKSLLTFGNIINDFVAYFKKSEDSKNSSVEAKTKKIIFNFLNLAEKIEDSSLNELAIDVAEKYQSDPKS